MKYQKYFSHSVFVHISSSFKLEKKSTDRKIIKPNFWRDCDDYGHFSIFKINDVTIFDLCCQIFSFLIPDKRSSLRVSIIFILRLGHIYYVHFTHARSNIVVLRSEMSARERKDYLLEIPILFALYTCYNYITSLLANVIADNCFK